MCVLYAPLGLIIYFPPTFTFSLLFWHNLNFAALVIPCIGVTLSQRDKFGIQQFCTNAYQWNEWLKWHDNQFWYFFSSNYQRKIDIHMNNWYNLEKENSSTFQYLYTTKSSFYLMKFLIELLCNYLTKGLSDIYTQFLQKERDVSNTNKTIYFRK